MQKNPETGVIHVVDDDSDIAKIASIALQHAGFYVHSFSDPAEALKDIELVCGKKVRMLITDLRMPGHNGFEVAKRTRAVVPDVPVIFMTAVDVNSDEFGRILPSFKVNAFLQKPFRIEKLLNVVREHLN